jgi:acetyl esterase/lipase
MQTGLVIVALVLLAGPALAAQPAPELLWPNGAPGAKGDKPADRPAIMVHLAAPEKATGAAVLICPGGGYGALMMSYEGHDVAKWLNGFGIAGIVLQYRIKPYQHPAPMTDAQRALRMVRSRAAELKLDPKRIGVMGFSAGGHLAGTLATHYDAGDQNAADPIEKASCRPDFAILVYPVITMGEKGHAGCRETLLGKTPKKEDVESLSLEAQVTAQTPPTFLVHSKTDQVVPVAHSLMFQEALKAKGVPCEYCELPTGAHGLGCGKGDLWQQWQAQCAAWLKKNGWGKE